MVIKKSIYFLLFLAILICLPWLSSEAQQNKILVWSAIREAVIREIATQFEKVQPGLKVEITEISYGELFRKYVASVAAGAGPDLVVGAPHDWLAELVPAGMVEPLDPPLQTELGIGQINDLAIQAMSWEGKLYGLPINLETIFLIYNKQLLAEPPQNMDRLVEEALKLTQDINGDGTIDQYGFVFDVNNLYYSWPFFSGYGAYIFKTTEEGLDPKQIGLAQNEAIMAAQFLADLVLKHKVVPEGATYVVMDELFLTGKAAMIINGPWALPRYGRQIDYGLAMIPILNNKKRPRPFLTVRAITLSSSSKEKKEAIEFMKYLAKTENLLKIYTFTGWIPCRQDLSEDPVLIKENPYIPIIYHQAQEAEPIPNIRAMYPVWTIMGEALTTITSGKVSPEEALVKAKEEIDKRIAEILPR